MAVANDATDDCSDDGLLYTLPLRVSSPKQTQHIGCGIIPDTPTVFGITSSRPAYSRPDKLFCYNQSFSKHAVTPDSSEPRQRRSTEISKTTGTSRTLTCAMERLHGFLGTEAGKGMIEIEAKLAFGGDIGQAIRFTEDFLIEAIRKIVC